MSSVPASNVATFANGCFWGTEHIFMQHFGKKGLLKSNVGYVGGDMNKYPNPSYEQVCSGRTGYAEASQFEFDPNQVSYAELVEFFYRTHDPTQLNAQGPDRGSQYRSAIFAHTDEQESTAKEVTKQVQEKHFSAKGSRIVTTIEQLPVSAL
ncbi:peptide-methionine (S)-S-oxide reductase [Malassezia yamatoensis]|uniref:peptide-methionine (S)-S-oxide reductase n=1 Tax=Malassezia yamatoensis TaxID=253288 RepID=A0AAJ6CEV1_9BASI|nr:peptide-methionine (S)-S-oxide reductase [Malassezia yamatoensis]